MLQSNIKPAGLAPKLTRMHKGGKYSFEVGPSIFEGLEAPSQNQMRMLFLLLPLVFIILQNQMRMLFLLLPLVFIILQAFPLFLQVFSGARGMKLETNLENRLPKHHPIGL
jgi:L-asparagine transporter-like permease